MPEPLNGKTVLITGAADGIGADTARRLAARGARLALLDLQAEALQRLAAELGPENTLALPGDVTDTAVLERAVAATVERFGGIDVCVANAGLSGIGTVAEMDPAAFDRTIEVNLLGVWRTVRACLPQLLQRRGYIAVNASLAAVAPGPGLAAYSASKAGAEAFARALGAEVKHQGVDVGVAYFSWIDTPLVQRADRRGTFKVLRTKGPIRKTYPVSDAGEAMVAGIESRARKICVPGWLRVAILLRGILDAAGAGQMAKRGEEVTRSWREEQTRIGVEDASMPPEQPGMRAEDRQPAART